MIQFVRYSYGIGAAPLERWCEIHAMTVLDEDWEDHLMTEHLNILGQEKP